MGHGAMPGPEAILAVEVVARAVAQPSCFAGVASQEPFRSFNFVDYKTTPEQCVRHALL